MRELEDYVRRATECRTMAAQAKDPEHKLQLEEMAAAWDMLAEKRRQMFTVTGVDAGPSRTNL